MFVGVYDGWEKVVGDKGLSHGGRVKGWYSRNAMICKLSIAKSKLPLDTGQNNNIQLPPA